MPKPSVVAVAVFLLIALVAGAAPAHATCFSTGEFNDSRLCWSPQRPLPGAFELEDVIWTEERGEFLALGGGGAILTSTDGQGWTPVRTGFVQRFYGAVFDGTRYILVGEGGLILTGTPEDGWTPRVTNTRLALFDVAWNGVAADPLYLAVGQNGTVLRSRDAVEWQASAIGIGEDGTLTVTDEALGAQQRPAPTLLGVAWGSGRFVVVGSSTTVISTANGESFLAHVHDPVDRIPLYDVAVSPDGAFAAVGDRGIFLKAQDHDWSAVERSEAFGDATLRGITWDPGRLAFLVVGTENPDDPEAPALILPLQVSGSLPGQNEFEGAPGVRLQGVAASAARPVAVARGAILTQTNEGQWVPITADPPPPVRDLHAIVRVDNVPGTEPFYLAAGEQGTLLRSTGNDGWAAIEDEDLSGQDLNGLARNEDENVPRIVAVGEGGLILWSADGDAWNRVEPDSIFNIAAVAFGTDGFVAVGQDGGILRSGDGQGESWNLEVAPGTNALPSLNDVAWRANPSLYVAVGAGGTIATSPDGATWTQIASGTDQPLRAVTWTGERFVAVGRDDSGGEPIPLVLTSEDGAGWSRVSELGIPADVTGGLVDVAWNGMQLLATLDGGGFLRSDDGEAWTLLSIDTEADRDTTVRALVAEGTRFLGVGAGGLILESGAPDVTLSVVALNPANVDDLPQFARADEPKALRFNVANIGNLDATGVQFSYQLPAGVQFADPPFEADGTNCQAFTDLVQCLIGRAVAGGTGAGVTIAVNIVPGDVDSIVNLAQITTQPADINPANDLMTFVTSIGAPEGPTLPSPDVEFVEGGALGWIWLLPLLWWAVWGRRRAPAR